MLLGPADKGCGEAGGSARWRGRDPRAYILYIHELATPYATGASAVAVPDREAHEAAARTLLTEGGALLHPTLARERVKCNRAHLAPRTVSLSGRRRAA